MAASLTARCRQKAQSSPAASTDDSRLAVVDDASATRAGDGEDEIGECRE